jgi:hypothetical protein
VIIDWFFLATIVVIGLGAWLAVAVLGALLVGRGIRMADEAEGTTNDEGPDPWEAGPGLRASWTLPTPRQANDEVGDPEDHVHDAPEHDDQRDADPGSGLSGGLAVGR